MISRSKIQLIGFLKQKKYRNLHKNFIAEGSKAIQDLINSGMECSFILYADDVTDFLKIDKDIIIETIDRKGFDKLSTQTNPAGILAVFEMPKLEFNPQNLIGKVTLILDNINDPGNLGTIIRVADWYGIEHIICSPNTVDCYNPKVVNSSMASIGNVNIFYQELIPLLDEINIPKYACTMDGESVYQYAKTQEALLIIGSESHGISEEIIQKCTAKINIPKIGKAESLNAAIACAIVCDVFLGR